MPEPPHVDGLGDQVDHGSWALLRDPAFGTFFAGRFLSTGGVWIYNIVAAILAYELTGSTFMVAMVSVVQFGPQLVLSPLSGSLADRRDRRTILVVSRLTIAAGSGSLAAMVALWGLDGMPGVWPLMVASFVVGIGFVLSAPAQNALIPSLVTPGHLSRAVALNAIPPTMSRATGPAVGAYVALSVGTAPAFALAALLNVAFAVIAARLPIVRAFDRPAGADKRVRAAIRYVRRDRAVAVLLLGVLAVGFGSDPVLTLTPAISDAFGKSTAHVGLFASMFGVGAGIALLAVPRLQRAVGAPTVVTGGLVVLAGATIAVSLAPVPWMAAVAFGVSGSGMGSAFASLSSQLHERVPDELRGRIMALWAVAYLGSRPVAALLTGSLADATSTNVALAAVGVAVGLAAWWCRPSQLTHRAWRRPASAE